MKPHLVTDESCMQAAVQQMMLRRCEDLFGDRTH